MSLNGDWTTTDKHNDLEMALLSDQKYKLANVIPQVIWLKVARSFPDLCNDSRSGRAKQKFKQSWLQVREHVLLKTLYHRIKSPAWNNPALAGGCIR